MRHFTISYVYSIVLAYKWTFSILLFLMLWMSNKLVAQDCPIMVEVLDMRTVPNFPQTDSIVVCGAVDTLSYLIYSPDASEDILGVELELELAPGLEYGGFAEGHFAWNTIYELDVTNPSRPKFTIPAMTNGEIFVANIGIAANCDFKPTSLASITTTLNFLYQDSLGAVHNCEYEQYIGEYKSAINTPVLNILSVSPATVQPSNFTNAACQTIQISQDGIKAYVESFEFFINDIVLDNSLALTSMTIGGNAVTYNYDNALQQVSATIDNTFFNDDYFNENETVSIQVCYTAQECMEPSDVFYDYVAEYGCNDKVCGSSSKEASLSFKPNFGASPVATSSFGNPGEFCGEPIRYSFEVSSANADPDEGLWNDLEIKFKSCETNNTEIGNITLNGATLTKGVEWDVVGANAVIDLTQVTTDFDGTGGLEDVDGDSFFDDLPGGNNILVEVELNVVCGSGVDCSPVSCSVERVEVNGLRNCGQTFQQFANVTPVSFFYGETSFDTNEDVERGTTGIFVTEEIDTDPNVYKPTVNGYSFVYEYGFDNISPCTPTGSLSLIVSVMANGDRPNHIRYLTGSATYEADGDGDVTTTPTGAVPGVTTQDILDPTSGAKLGLEITIPMGDATATTHEYFFNLEYEGQCFPDDYVYLSYTVVEECDGCGTECRIVRSCQSAQSWVDWQGTSCECSLRSSIDTLYRTNYGYADKAMTQPLTANDVPVEDRQRFLPGDTMFIRAAYEVINSEVMYTADRAWTMNIFQRGYRGPGRLDFNQATFEGWYWEDVSAGTPMQEIGIPTCHQQYPDSTRDNYYYPSIRLGNYGMEGHGTTNSGQANAYRNCLTDSNVNPDYHPETAVNHDSYGSSHDFYDGYFSFNIYFGTLEECPITNGNAITGGSQDHYNTCHQEFMQQFPIEDGDVIYIELSVPVFHNPYSDPTATANTANYLSPSMGVYSVAPSCGNVTIAGACNTTRPFEAYNPGPVNVSSTVNITDCDISVNHTFSLSNPVPTVAVDETPWFENEYRPFMAVEYLQMQFPSNLAYLGNATIVDYFGNNTLVPGQYVDDNYGNLNCIDDGSGNVCCAAADNTQPASIRFNDNDYYVAESIPFYHGPSHNGLNNLQTGDNYCDVIPLIHKPLDPFPMLSVGGTNDCTWALEYDLQALCPDELEITDFQFTAQMAEIFVPNLNAVGWDRSNPDTQANSFENLIDSVTYEQYRNGTRYWGQCIPHPLATRHVARQVIVNNFTPSNFVDNSLDYPPLTPTVSQNLIADLENQNEVVEYTVCAGDASLGGSTHQNVSTSIFIPPTIGLIGITDDNDATLIVTTLEVTPEGTSYQVNMSDLAPSECYTIKIITELLFCPIGLDMPVTICAKTTSGCISPEKQAALSLEADACNETETCYQYIKEEAEIQAEWYIQPSGEEGLCDTLDFAVRIKNVKPAQLINLDLEWWLPTGLSFVPGSWQFQFPGGLTTFGPIVSIDDPDPNPANNNAWGTAFYYPDDLIFSPDIHANGLEGISPENTTEDENKFIIHFRAVTNCETFVSGTPARFIAKASDPCEQQVTSGTVETNPIIIENANPANFAQLLTYADSESLNCGHTTDLIFTSLNIAPLGETNSSRMCMTLPTNGLTYTPNSVQYLAPVGFPTNAVETNLGGAMEICVDVPDGVGPGEFFSLSVEVTMDGDVVCGSIDVGVQIASYIADQGCEAQGLDCGVNVLNSVNPTVPIELLPPLNVEDLLVTTDCDSDPDNVTFNYQVDLSNPSDNYSGDITIEIIRDLDLNGMLDSYDPVLDTEVQNATINSGDTLSLTGQFTVPEPISCPVFVRVTQETACVCDLQSFYLDTFEPQFFADLGEKQVLCPGEDLGFGICEDVTLDMFSLDPAAGGTIMLSADGDSVYVSLTDGYGINSAVTLNLETTTGTCTNEFSTQIYTIEDFSIGPFDPIDMCSNACTRLNLNMPVEWVGNVDILWSPTDFLDDPTSHEPEICNPTTTTNYTITLTLGEGADACTTQSTYLVNVEDPTTEDVLTGGLVCDGYFYSIVAPAGYDNYTWYQVINGGNSVPVKGGSENFYDTYVAGTFWVEYANAADVCKTSSNQVQTTMVPKPDIDPTTDAFCINFANDRDLTSYENAMNVNTLAGDFTWYEDAATAIPVATPTNVNVVDGDDYFAVFMDGNGCKDTASVTFTVYPLPILNNPVDTICIEIADNVDLSSYESQVTTDTGTFSWYTDAAATNAIADPTAVAVIDDDVFYVIFQDGNTCQDTANLTFEVYPLTPEATLMTTESVCLDRKADNKHVIDLNDLINTGPTTGTWADDDATGALIGSVFTATDPMAGNTYNFTYTIDGMPGAATDSGCYDNNYTVSIEVRERCCPNLLLLTMPSDICTGETEAGPLNITIDHESQPEALALYYSTDNTLTANDLYSTGNGGATAINSAIAPTGLSTTETGVNLPANTTNNTITYTIYAILGDGNSFIEDPDCLPMLTTTIDVYHLPTVAPAEIFACDNNDGNNETDGITNFTLTEADTIVDVLSGNAVTYHSTQADADANANALTSPYNAANGTIIYARIETPNNCYRTVPVTLSLYPLPNISSASIEACDKNDGTGDFELASLDATIDVDSGNTVTYHSTQTDADAGSNALVLPHNDVDGATVYARVENADGCHRTSEVSLILLPSPILEDANIEECDRGDGSSEFDLSGINNYYVTLSDAENETNPLAVNYISSGEIIYIRVNATNGCYTIRQITLIVLPLPNVTDTQLAICDSGDGTATYTLSDADTSIDLDGGNTVTYHNNQLNALQGLNAVANTFVGSGGEQFWARVEDDKGCFRVAQLTLILHPLPNIAPADLYSCNNGDDTADFTLTDADTTIDVDGGNTVTYHALESDAMAGINPLTSSYTAAEDTIYARVTDANSCFRYEEIYLHIWPLPVVANAMLYVCDDGDGAVDFTLEDADTIVDVNGGNVVTYHPSQADAEAATNALSSPYNSTGETVYARVEDVNGCFDVAQVMLEVVLLPTAQAIEIESCDNGDGTADFPLDTYANSIDTDGGNTVTFHATQADADANANALTSPYNSLDALIYARVTDEHGCYTTAMITLTTKASPILSNTEVRECDRGDGMAEFDLSTLGITYYPTLADAENETNPMPSSYTGSSVVLYSRVNNTNDCYVIAEVTLTVIPLPAIAVTEYSFCDDGDGNLDITLSDMDSAIDISGTNTVSYHSTQLDAFNNVNALSSPYNTSGNETIYVRVADTEECANLGELTIQIIPRPTATNAEAYSCDNGDGTAIFDLTASDADVDLAGGNTVTYHALQADADADINPLTSPYISAGGVIYVRITAGNGCYHTSELILNIWPKPVATPTSIEICDEGGDGTEAFDLIQFDAVVDGTTTNTVTYHTSGADADANINPLNNPYSTAGATIFARVEDTNGCYDVSEVVLIVHPTPIALPAQIELCDINNDDSEAFDLNSLMAMVDTTGNHAVTFHSTQADADVGNAPLTSPYNSSSDTIYARVADVTGCYATSEIILTLYPIPNVADTQLQACDNGDGTADFLLSFATDDVDVDGGNTVTYYATQAEALAGAGTPLSEPYNTISTIIYAHVINAQACSAIATITLDVEVSPILQSAELLECDSGNGEAEFDLSTGSGMYYESLADAETQTNPMVGGTYIGSSDTLYLRVNATNNCYTIAEVILTVLPLPNIANTELAMCDDGDGMVDFDLSQATASIDLDGANTVTYHNSIIDATTGNNPLAMVYSSSGETIFARVNTDEGCYLIAELDLVVHPLPTAFAAEQQSCPDEDGIIDFDLTDSNATIDPSGNYNITYHTSQADADANINALTSPYSTAGTILFARITDTNGCYTTAPLTLTVLTLPTAAPHAMNGCLNEGFDLSDADSIVDSTGNNAVTYHEQLNDAEQNINPILDNPYIGAGIIYARVTDANACYAISEVQLSINLIGINDVEVALCEDEANSVDLSDYETQITNLTGNFTWHGDSNLTAPMTETANITVGNGATFFALFDATEMGCTDTATLSFMVHPVTSMATINPVAEVCNADDGNGENTIDLQSLIVNGDTNGTWNDTDGTGILAGSLFTATSSMAGNIYTFTYIIEGSTGTSGGACGNQSYEVNIMVNDCAPSCQPNICIPITITKVNE